MAFAIGSALGGVAGALYAPLVAVSSIRSPFTLSLSLDLLMMVIVGGSGFFFGPFLGAIDRRAAARMAALHGGLLSDALRASP